MFSHVQLGIGAFDAAFRFWSAVAAELDLQLRFHAPDRHWAGWQAEGRDRPLFLIGRPFDGGAALPGNGQMVAFLATSRTVVDRVHAAALAAGGVCEGEPGLRPQYHPNYYGAYFRDLDGNKACVCCHEPVPD